MAVPADRVRTDADGVAALARDWARGVAEVERLTRPDDTASKALDAAALSTSPAEACTEEPSAFDQYAIAPSAS